MCTHGRKQELESSWAIEVLNIKHQYKLVESQTRVNPKTEILETPQLRKFQKTNKGENYIQMETETKTNFKTERKRNEKLTYQQALSLTSRTEIRKTNT